MRKNTKSSNTPPKYSFHKDFEFIPPKGYTFNNNYVPILNFGIALFISDNNLSFSNYNKKISKNIIDMNDYYGTIFRKTRWTKKLLKSLSEIGEKVTPQSKISTKLFGFWDIKKHIFINMMSDNIYFVNNTNCSIYILKDKHNINYNTKKKYKEIKNYKWELYDDEPYYEEPYDEEPTEYGNNIILTSNL